MLQAFLGLVHGRAYDPLYGCTDGHLIISKILYGIIKLNIEPAWVCVL